MTREDETLPFVEVDTDDIETPKNKKPLTAQLRKSGASIAGLWISNLADR
jgi:hypothetical protein